MPGMLVDFRQEGGCGRRLRCGRLTGLVAHARAALSGLCERLDCLRGFGELVLAVRFDDAEHVHGDAGLAADLTDCPLPRLRRGQLVQLLLEFVSPGGFLAQPVGLVGLLTVGFGELLPLACLGLPVGRVAMRLRARALGLRAGRRGGRFLRLLRAGALGGLVGVASAMSCPF